MTASSFVLLVAFLGWIWYANKLAKTKLAADAAIAECMREIRLLRESILWDGDVDRWSSDRYEERRKDALRAIHDYSQQAGVKNYLPALTESSFPSFQNHDEWKKAEIRRKGPFGDGWGNEQT